MRTKEPLLADILRAEHNNFGLLRLLMAFAVLVSHAYWLTTGQTALEPLYRWTGHTLGEHAVQVFFFLSGVVVTQSLLRSGSVLDFALGRSLRIFPALIVCVLLTAFVLGPIVTALGPKAYFADKGVIAYIAKTVSLATGSAPLPGAFADNPVPHLVNLSLWTLKFEVGCYALLAVFGLAYLKFEQWRPYLVAALAAVLAVIFIGSGKPAGSYTALDNVRYFVLYFGAGVLAFLLKDWLVISWRALPALFILFWASIGTGFSEVMCALFLGYGTLVAAAVPTGALRTATNEQDYSYAFYILHCPIQQALVQHGDGVGALTLTVVTTLAVLPLAILSWNFVEAPAMATRKSILAWLRGRMGSRAAGAPAPKLAPQPMPEGFPATRTVTRIAPVHLPPPLPLPAPHLIPDSQHVPIRRINGHPRLR